MRSRNGPSGPGAHGRLVVEVTPAIAFENWSATTLRTTTEETMKRKASAVWRGGLKEGKGTISTESGVLAQTQYSFSTRFESGVGTNPEELIAAAHAGCFSMALSAELGKTGMTPESIQTNANLTME